MTSADGARCRAIGAASCRNGLARIFASTRSNGAAATNWGAEKPVARIACTRCPATFSRAFSRATCTEGGSISLASTFPCSAVAAGAECQRRLDFDAELVGRDPLAVMLAVNDEASGRHGDEVFEAGLDP